MFVSQDQWTLIIWEAYLGLSVLGQDTWGDLVDLGDKLVHWVIWEMRLERRSVSNMSQEKGYRSSERLSVSGWI